MHSHSFIVKNSLVDDISKDCLMPKPAEYAITDDENSCKVVTNIGTFTWNADTVTTFDDTLTLTTQDFDFSLAMNEEACNDGISDITTTAQSVTPD